MVASQQQLQIDDQLFEELREIVGEENVLSEPDELLVYETDGLPQHKHLPRAVVFPNSTEETSDVLAVLHGQGVSFAPRGAGTGLSGGALAINRGVVVELARMRKILRLIAKTAPRACRQVWLMRNFHALLRRLACTTCPILPVSHHARSAATSPKTPAAFIA
jgi:hypothetical protein